MPFVFLNKYLFDQDILNEAANYQGFNSFYLLIISSLLTFIFFYKYCNKELIISLPMIINPLIELHIGGFFYCTQYEFKVPIFTSLVIYIMTWSPLILVYFICSFLDNNFYKVDLDELIQYLKTNKVLLLLNRLVIGLFFLIVLLITLNRNFLVYVQNPRAIYELLIISNLQILLTIPGIIISVISALNLFVGAYTPAIFSFIILFFMGKKYYIFLPIILYFLLRSITILKLPKIKNLLFASIVLVFIFSSTAIIYASLGERSTVSIYEQLARSFDYIGGFNYFLNNSGPGITEGEIGKTSYLFFIPRFLYPEKPEIYGHNLVHLQLLPDLISQKYSASLYSAFTVYLGDHGIIMGLIIHALKSSIFLIPLALKEVRKNNILFISYIFFVFNAFSGFFVFFILWGSSFLKRKSRISNKLN